MITHKQILFSDCSRIQKHCMSEKRLRYKQYTCMVPFDYYSGFHIFLMSYHTNTNVRHNTIYSRMLTSDRILDMVRDGTAYFRRYVAYVCTNEQMNVLIELSKDKSVVVREAAKNRIKELNDNLNDNT